MTTATRTWYIGPDGNPEVMILCPHGMTEYVVNLSRGGARPIAERAAIVRVEEYHRRQYYCDCSEIIELPSNALADVMFTPEYYEELAQETEARRAWEAEARRTRE
jgi:hypothetical protein